MTASEAERKNEQEVGADTARDTLTDLMDRAALRGERTVVTRNGKPRAAIVPISDLDILRALDAA